MTMVRAIGWMLLFPAVLIISYGLVIGFEGVAVTEISAAEYLAGHRTAEPDFVQAAAQRYLRAALADPSSLAILRYPLAEAMAILAGIVAVPGLVVLILFRRGWSGALIRREYTRRAAPTRQ